MRYDVSGIKAIDIYKEFLILNKTVSRKTTFLLEPNDPHG